MSDLLNQVGMSIAGVGLGVAIFLATFFGSIAVVAVLLVKLPPTYFLDRHSRTSWCEGSNCVMRWSVFLLKNLLGIVVVAMGLVMLVTPGQGVLTVLIGVMLLSFPGKRRLERKLVSRPSVLRAINRWRARYGKPPLILDESPDPLDRAPQTARDEEAAAAEGVFLGQDSDPVRHS